MSCCGVDDGVALGAQVTSLVALAREECSLNACRAVFTDINTQKGSRSQELLLHAVCWIRVTEKMDKRTGQISLSSSPNSKYVTPTLKALLTWSAVYDALTFRDITATNSAKRNIA